VGQVLAVVSQKGGVGKTTTAINVAAALALRGVKTLLVDADPQGSVAHGLGLHSAGDRIGLSDYVTDSTPMHQIVRPTLLPWLRAVTAGTVSEDDSDHDTYARRLAHSDRMDELFGRARAHGYVVVVDTPPGLGMIVNRVLASAGRVLVPLQSEPLALQTTGQILRGIRAALAVNLALTFEGILLTMVESGNAVSERVAAVVRQELPAGMVLDIAIPRTAASAEAFGASQPLVLRSPDDEAARAYGALASRLEERLR